MKCFMFLLIASVMVCSQGIPLELKDSPTSITFYVEDTSIVANFFYDSQNRLIKIDGGDMYANCTLSYSKKVDTTIVTYYYEADPQRELEADSDIVKQLYNTQGKLTYEIAYLDGKPYEEISYFYNTYGDLSKITSEASDGTGISFNDSLVYDWDYNQHLVSESYYNDKGELLTYSEYEIDDQKRFTKIICFDCEETCQKNGLYAVLTYKSSSIAKRPVFKSKVNRVSDNKTFTIDGRVVKGMNPGVSSVLVTGQNQMRVRKLFLK